METVLVTGGAGYIGSHTVLDLIKKGFDVIIADDFSNSSKKVISILEKLADRKIKYYELDIRNKEGLREIFKENKIDAVINFAGYKAVGESVEKPLMYYDNNLIGMIVLLEVMEEFSVKKLVFSSSATVYGIPKAMPLVEDNDMGATNPYGRTKLFLEEIFTDLYISDNEWNIILLRYFNPIGAHKSGRIGENPNGIPNNLVPYITQVAVGKLDYVRVFGDDYETKDGTGVRDYIHVLDLALGHIKAIKKFEDSKAVRIYNLGTGEGYSVLDMIKNFEEVTGKKIKYVVTPRRSGDIAECYADSTKAKEELGWEAKYGIREMCEDSWRWQVNNPNGYED
mgnify:CR=1 FL=1